MTQPYNKSSILLNTPVEYSKRYLYTYEWYVNTELVSTDPNYTYLFPKSGIYNIKLVLTDKDSGLSTITLRTLQTVIPRQDYVVHSGGAITPPGYVLPPSLPGVGGAFFYVKAI